MKPIRILTACGWILLLACSSTPRNGEHLLHKILLYNLHLRRPEGVGAQFKDELGDQGYESHPKPNARLDCEPLKWLFKEIKLEALRKCFEDSIKMHSPSEISYILHREVMP